jgi:hypothetical protein
MVDDFWEAVLAALLVWQRLSAIERLYENILSGPTNLSAYAL